VPDLTGQSLAIERRIGNRYGEVHALNILAEGQRGRGRTVEALAAHREALELAREIGHREDEARALDGIARIQYDGGDRAAAGRHWRQALDLYTELKMAQADEVRARLETG